MIALTRYALIAMAVILAPVWLVWVVGGMIADRLGQRALAMLKATELLRQLNTGV